MGNLPMKHVALVFTRGTALAALFACGGTVAPIPEACAMLTASSCNKNLSCLETTGYEDAKNRNNRGCFQKCEAGSTDSCGALRECTELRPPYTPGDKGDYINTIWVCLPKP
jgi:hypothetical protein